MPDISAIILASIVLALAIALTVEATIACSRRGRR
jgi:hypothetical protein